MSDGTTIEQFINYLVRDCYVRDVTASDTRGRALVLAVYRTDNRHAGTVALNHWEDDWYSMYFRGGARRCCRIASVAVERVARGDTAHTFRGA